MPTRARRALRALAVCVALHLGVVQGAAAQIRTDSDFHARRTYVACTPERLQAGQLCNDFMEFEFRGAIPVVQLWQAQKFEQLDALFERWCTEETRFVDGSWMLSSFGAGISQHLKDTRNWPAAAESLKRWQARVPGSLAARYVEGLYWQAYAWQALSGGVVASLPKEAMEIFRERIDKALDVNSTALGSSTKACPAFLAQALDLLIDAEAPAAAVQAMFDRSVDAQPLYVDTYLIMSRLSRPSEGGSARAMDRLVRRAVAATRPREGTGMVARLYGVPGIDPALRFPTRSGIPTWPDLRQSFDDLMARHPSSIRTLLRYMEMACLSQDSATYRRLRPKLPPQVQFAPGTTSVDACDLRHGHVAAK